MRLAIAAVLCLAAVPATARDPQGRYSGSQYAEWFKSQHNSTGQWCCDESDGHYYDDDYKVNADGSVTVMLNGKPHVIEKAKVLTSANPTGRAVWWFTSGDWGHQDYCFAPGSLT